MKVRTVACSFLLVAASVGGAGTLAASAPDCARWIKEYQQGLAHRATSGKKHVVKAAHRLVVPKFRLQRASVQTGRVRPPKLSPAEMLKRFKVLCGEDLPDEVIQAQFLPTGLEDTMVPLAGTPAGNDTIAGLTGNGAPMPFGPVTSTGTGTGTPPAGTGTPQPGTGTNGGPPIIPIVPGSPGTPGVPPPVVPPPVVSPVPEPGTFALLLTGLGALPAVLRLRSKAKTA